MNHDENLRNGTDGETDRSGAGGLRIGYVRVSTADQSVESQVDALRAAGCERIYIDQGVSGKLAHRPELDKALGYLRRGDTLVVTRLDRLGRSVKNLKAIADRFEAEGINLIAISQGIDTTTPMGRLFFHVLAAIAEFEHDLIVERTQEGLKAARARGRSGGRKQKMSKVQIEQARVMYDSQKYSVQKIADAFKVSRQTIYRSLENRDAN